MHSKFQVSSFSRSWDTTGGHKIKKWVPIPLSVGRSGPTSNTVFYGPPRLFTRNRILICSAIFAQRSRDQKHDRQTSRLSVTIVCISCIRCSLKLVQNRSKHDVKAIRDANYCNRWSRSVSVCQSVRHVRHCSYSFSRWRHDATIVTSLLSLHRLLYEPREAIETLRQWCLL